ncbi:transcriptional repressor TUP1 [Pelomyxa schiedti]|nr:transcriptional repressor TUP1 [Pelomyxa schiedti]
MSSSSSRSRGGGVVPSSSSSSSSSSANSLVGVGSSTALQLQLLQQLANTQAAGLPLLASLSNATSQGPPASPPTGLGLGLSAATVPQATQQFLQMQLLQQLQQPQVAAVFPQIPSRCVELIDQFKQEVEMLAKECQLYKAQRDEIEKKLQQQLVSVGDILSELGAMERQHNELKQSYEEEMALLKKQLESPIPPITSATNLRLTQEPPPIIGEEKPKAKKDTTNDWISLSPQGVNTKLTVELLHTLSHNTVVCCVKFSEDGKYVATGCNRTAQIFEVETGKKIRSFPPPEEINMECDLYIRAVCFSPDGSILATGAEDRTVKLWDIAREQLKATLAGHDNDIYALAFSHDGKFIVSGSGDRHVKIWSVETGKILHTLGNDEVGPKDGVTSVAVSPDDKMIAAGSLDHIIRVWDASTGYFLERFEGHDDSVYSVAFSPDGKLLASGSLDRTIKMWDLHISVRHRSRCHATLTAHKDYVLSVAFSPDGRWLVSGSKDRSVQFWDSSGCPDIVLYGHKNSVISIALSNTGGLFATGSGDFRARIWRYNPSLPPMAVNLHQGLAGAGLPPSFPSTTPIHNQITALTQALMSPTSASTSTPTTTTTPTSTPTPPTMLTSAVSNSPSTSTTSTTHRASSPPLPLPPPSTTIVPALVPPSTLTPQQGVATPTASGTTSSPSSSSSSTTQLITPQPPQATQDVLLPAVEQQQSTTNSRPMSPRDIPAMEDE